MSNRKSEETRVLVSFNAPRTADNHFVNLFTEAVGNEKVRITHFSPKAVLLSRIDVVNLHWPELVVRGSSPIRRLVKYALVMVLLLRVVLQRIPVIYTVHNLRPHEEIRSRVERVLYARLSGSACFRVFLNEAESNEYSEGAVILHGAYPVREPTAITPAAEAASRTALFSGNIRPYKGVERVFDFARVATGDVRYLIAGTGNDNEYTAGLERTAAHLSNVTMNLGYLDDDSLVALIRESGAIILPYRDMYNSGVVLLSLSLSRPVVVPESDANKALALEVGPEWVELLEPNATDSDWADAVQRAAERGLQMRAAQESPDLTRRNWRDIGGLYRSLFETANRRRRARTRTGYGEDLRALVSSSSEFRSHSRFNIRDGSDV